MTSDEYLKLCEPYMADANELSEAVKEYNMGRTELQKELNNRTVTVRKSVGGKTIHRGFYCPSLVKDIVIGNCKRGRLSKSDAAKADYLHYFDADNKHIATRMVHMENDDIEFIIQVGNKSLGLSYSGKRLENVSICEYDEDGRILKYIYASSDMFQIEKEIYVYEKDKLVVNHSTMLNCKPVILLLDRYDFNVENGYLKNYTVEVFGTENLEKEDLEGRTFDVKIKRKVQI